MTTVLLFLSPSGKTVMASIVMVALIYIWVSLPWFYRSFETRVPRNAALALLAPES